MIVRRETEADLDGIYDLVKLAFQTAKVTNGDEQEYQVRLRNGDNYIPELALVAEEDGQLVGHIMLTRTYITDGDDKHEALLLGPLSVPVGVSQAGDRQAADRGEHAPGQRDGLWGGLPGGRSGVLSPVWFRAGGEVRDKGHARYSG